VVVVELLTLADQRRVVLLRDGGVRAGRGDRVQPAGGDQADAECEQAGQPAAQLPR
jgi:hypothetical protein